MGRPMQRPGARVVCEAAGRERERARGSAASAVVAGRPAARQAPHRRRRRSRVPLPQPQELGTAGVPASGRTATHAQSARLAPLRRGGRPARGVAVVPGGDPTRARPSGRPGWRPGQDLAARRHHGGRGRVGPRSLERRRPAPGPGRRPPRRSRDPARRGLRVVAALRAPSARGRHRVDPARGGIGTPGPWGPRPSTRRGRPGCPDESSGRKPPGAVDQALPPRR